MKRIIKGWNAPVILISTVLITGCYPDGLSVRSDTPPQTSPPLTPPPAKSITAGKDHFFAVHDGKVIGWGNNVSDKSTAPLLDAPPLSLSAGLNHSALIDADGRVINFGVNTGHGLASIPELQDPIKVVAGKNTNIVLQQDGKLVVWGQREESSRRLTEGQITVDVDMGHDHFLALLEDGRVVAWGGPSDHGELKLPSDLTDDYRAIKIAAGEHHNVILREDGAVIAWGENASGQCDVPEFDLPVKEVEAGLHQSFALLEDGSLVVWGAPLAHSDIPDNITEIDVDEQQVIVRTESGEVHVLQSKRPLNLTALKTADFSSGAFSVDSFGSVSPIFQGTELPNNLNAAPVVKLEAQDTAFANTYPYLSLPISFWGDTPSDPEAIFPRSNRRDISIAVSEVENLFGWTERDDRFGLTPTLSDFLGIVDASCGLRHCLALDRNNELYVWGSSFMEDLPIPQNALNAQITAVSAGTYVSMVLTETGDVITWGTEEINAWPAANLEAPAKAIFAGDKQAAAITVEGDGMFWSDWGSVDLPGPLRQIGFGDYNDIYTLSEAGEVLHWRRTDGQNPLSLSPEPVDYEWPIDHIYVADRHLNVVDDTGRLAMYGYFHIPFELTEFVAGYH